MNSMRLISILFILSLIYALSGSADVKDDPHRVRREEQKFVETTCTLINSVKKERCSSSITKYSSDRSTATKSCVFDERFRVKYPTADGKEIASTIETYGRNFPTLMQVN
jgi:hypothetical protein